MAASITVQANQGETFQLPSNNAGNLLAKASLQVIHDDVKAPGILFASNTFTHVSTDLTPFGVDDSWAVQCTFITNDAGFDDCVIGQPHWDLGIGDIHVFNFGADFTTATPIRVRCIATKVA
jgi:hypothetical protein